VFPVHATRAHKVSKGTDPLILNTEQALRQNTCYQNSITRPLDFPV